jgi:hypothetical protein
LEDPLPEGSSEEETVRPVAAEGGQEFQLGNADILRFIHHDEVEGGDFRGDTSSRELNRLRARTRRRGVVRDGDKLLIRGTGEALPAGLREEVANHKAELLIAL